MKLPGVSELVRLPGQGVQALEQALELIPRAAGLISHAESLIARADRMMTQVEPLVAASALLVDRGTALLDDFEPSLQRLAPVLERLSTTTEPDEVEAVVRLIDLLPELVGKLRSDILPILDTLGTVAPDVRDMLDMVRQLNSIIGAVPGLRKVKERAEEEAGDLSEYRSNEEPPAAPARRPELAVSPPAPVGPSAPVSPPAPAGPSAPVEPSVGDPAITALP